MHRMAGLLGIILALLIALPSVSPAADHPKKYGVDIQLGGGYYSMKDINDFLPVEFNQPTFTPPEPDKINIGEQFGIGMTYRNIDNFGWQLGFNKMALLGIQKHRVEVQLPGTPDVSWAEQTISGSEFYILATWYSDTEIGDLFFGVGPAVYWAKLDRSVDIINDQSGGSHLTKGSFANAEGKSVGAMVTLGLELTLGTSTGLSFQLGGRYAPVNELEYEDQSTQQNEIVYKNLGTGSKMVVDYTGGFFKITLRSYFQPSSDWRNPKR